MYYVVGGVTAKANALTKTRYNEPRYSEFHHIVNKTQLLF